MADRGIRRPTRQGTVWLHIDRLDRQDGRVWAVQWRGKKRACYKAVHEVSVDAPGITVRFGGPTSTLQPRAVVIFSPAIVKVRRTGAFWRAVIKVDADVE